MSQAKPVPITNKTAAKHSWMTAKLTINLPKTLAADFDAECKERGLSKEGVLRDLAICWLIANREGVKPEAYRAKIQDELNLAKVAVDEIAKRNKAKTTSLEKLAKNRKKFEESKPPVGPEVNLQLENPFEQWRAD